MQSLVSRALKSCTFWTGSKRLTAPMRYCQVLEPRTGYTEVLSLNLFGVCIAEIANIIVKIIFCLNNSVLVVVFVLF